jgi:hypothetical protein
MASGMLRMKSPAAPGRASRGRKAKTSVAVQPRTDSVICFVARMAASWGVSPCRRKRAMFSTTTTESSTSSPSAMTNPTMESWFTEKPVKRSSVTPIASESGIETITTPEARRPSGRSVTSTSRMAMPKSRTKPERRCSTLPA